MIISIFLGSTELTSNNRFVQSIRNMGFPDIDYSTVKKGGFTGKKISPGKFSSYKIVIEWQIVGTSFSDLATQRENFILLLGKIISSGSQTLKINKANGVNIQVDVKAVDVFSDPDAADPLNARVLTEMEAEYPFLRSQTESSSDVFIFSGGGAAIPMVIPLDMSVGGINEATITQNGNYEAYPVFTFVGPLSNPTIANLTTGKTLNINTSLASAGDMLEVDIFLRTAKLLPSGANVRQFVTGDFWTLAVGSNLIHLGSGSFNSVGKCSIKFRDTYLGV